MLMVSLPAKVWNEIAELGPIRTEWAKERFPLNDEGIQQAEEQDADQLDSDGVDPMIVQAFLDARPLLLEREAIARYVLRHPELRGTLPEVNSINEAILLVTGDWPLSQSETERLRTLLDAAKNGRP